MKQDKIQETLIFNIKSGRKVNGLAQKDLAKVLDVKLCKVGSWEDGRAMPSLEMIIKLSDFFGYDMRAMITQPINNGGIM